LYQDIGLRQVKRVVSHLHTPVDAVNSAKLTHSTVMLTL